MTGSDDDANATASVGEDAVLTNAPADDDVQASAGECLGTTTLMKMTWKLKTMMIAPALKSILFHFYAI